MIKIYCIFCFLLCSLNAFGEESQAKIELARKMMSLDGTYSAIDDVKLEVINQIKSDLANLGMSLGSNTFINDLDKNLDTTELAKKFEIIICNSFSTDDLNAAIKFFSTPEGQSFIKANRNFNKGTKRVVKDWILSGKNTAFHEPSK